jgi:hypothetical protein
MFVSSCQSSGSAIGDAMKASCYTLGKQWRKRVSVANRTPGLIQGPIAYCVKGGTDLDEDVRFLLLKG